MRVSVDQNKIIYVTKLKLNSVTSTMYQAIASHGTRLVSLFLKRLKKVVLECII